jgi:adenosylhomocysteine nucleosidase
VLILAPQLFELEILLASFHQVGRNSSPSNIGRIQAWKIPQVGTLAVAGHGKAQFALQAQHLLDCTADVEGIVCVGGAGGIDSRLQVGDIVVGTVTLEHDYCIRFIDCPIPEFRASEAFLAELKTIAQTTNIEGKVWFERIASGDEDIVDAERADELRNATGAVCVAWEGSGAARAAAFNNVPFVEIRGITDSASATAHGDYHQNLKIVMPRIAELLLVWRTGGQPLTDTF